MDPLLYIENSVKKLLPLSVSYPDASSLYSLQRFATSSKSGFYFALPLISRVVSSTRVTSLSTTGNLYSSLSRNTKNAAIASSFPVIVILTSFQSAILFSSYLKKTYLPLYGLMTGMSYPVWGWLL